MEHSLQLFKIRPPEIVYASHFSLVFIPTAMQLRRLGLKYA